MKSLNPVCYFTAVVTAALISAAPVVGAESTLASGTWSKKENTVSGKWCSIK